jgi:hypothetical protein
LIIRDDEQDIALRAGRIGSRFGGAIEYGTAGQSQASSCHKQVAALHARTPEDSQCGIVKRFFMQYSPLFCAVPSYQRQITFVVIFCLRWFV